MAERPESPVGRAGDAARDPGRSRSFHRPPVWRMQAIPLEALDLCPLPMRTPRDTTPRPAPIRLTHSGAARRCIVGVLLLSLAACGQKGALYREKKPESRLSSDAALLLP
jgi:hypothetical protein